ncbi:fatty acid synthase alpha subunit Lsd1, partial [Entomophthora muscae]
QTHSLVTLNSAILKYSISNNKGNFHDMLGIYKLLPDENKQHVKTINHHYYKGHHISIDLLNDLYSSAYVGHPQRLNGLKLVLHMDKAADSLN